MSDTQQLNQLMQASAEDAITYMRTDFSKIVSLCQQDIKHIDLVLTQLSFQHIQTPLTQEKLFTICSILGAFVGEVFKQTAGGEWFMDQSVPDAPFVVLNYAGKSFPFASICYEKIANDPQINIAKYYELALGGSTQ